MAWQADCWLHSFTEEGGPPPPHSSSPAPCPDKPIVQRLETGGCIQGTRLSHCGAEEGGTMGL